ncbi:response regulator [Legionella sp. MW5194]|uniref:response regulator n=1 Tax=Legionella sp. MW5194 TaxID=2662448 RepID=UPI00193E6EBE|nr:response regulator [Legionella sp. MW5194]QRN03015.1 response regulator [Legionella sp. MW5194]
MNNRVIKPQDNRKHGLKTIDILIVEDNPEVKEAMVWFIELQGYTVCCADNGRHALTLLKNELCPSLILLDLMMPEMDGFAFRDVQAQWPYLAAIPTIVTSANGRIERMEQRENEFFMKKPIDTHILLSLLQKYLRSAS